jgi:hypothetical protein
MEGGTIYGYNGGSKSNTATEGISSNDRGHAVYAFSKRRETTAGPEVNLDSGIDGTEGGWED